MSGYDIKKFVGESIGYFWNESYGQIYPMLKRIAAQGLAEARVERQNGKPDRQVYSLTPAGRARLEQWLKLPPQMPPPRNELLLKLFFGRLGDRADVVRHVQEFRQRQEDLLRQYAHVERWLRRDHAKHPDLPYWLVTLSYGVHQSRALVAWCDETLSTLTRLPKAPKHSNRKQKRGERR